MDEDSDQEDETRKRIAQNKKEEAAATNSTKSQLMKKDLPLPPNPDHVIIRRDYDPKEKQTQSASAAASNSKQGGDTYFKSPLTGELIPSSSMSEHMRIAMLDPRWIEQRQKEKKEREEQEEVLASGFSIEKNLKRLAEYRSDVFGRGDDEVIIGRKLGDEEEQQQQQKKKEDSITWDGHKNTVEKTTNRALTGISAEDQIQKTNESQQQSSVFIRPPVPPQTQTMMNISNYKMLNTPVMTGMIRPPPQQLLQQQPPPRRCARTHGKRAARSACSGQASPRPTRACLANLRCVLACRAWTTSSPDVSTVPCRPHRPLVPTMAPSQSPLPGRPASPLRATSARIRLTDAREHQSRGSILIVLVSDRACDRGARPLCSPSGRASSDRRGRKLEVRCSGVGGREPCWQRQ